MKNQDVETVSRKPPVDGDLWRALESTEAELVQAEERGDEARVGALSHRLTALVLDLVNRVRSRSGTKAVNRE